MIDQKLAEMRVRLKKEVTEAMEEVGDVVDEVSRDYAEIKPLVQSNPNLVIDMFCDILIEDAHIPKYIPRFAVKFILSRILKRYL